MGERLAPRSQGKAKAAGSGSLIFQPRIPSLNPIICTYQLETARSTQGLIPWVRETEKQPVPVLSPSGPGTGPQRNPGVLLSPRAHSGGPSPADSSCSLPTLPPNFPSSLPTLPLSPHHLRSKLQLTFLPPAMPLNLCYASTHTVQDGPQGTGRKTASWVLTSSSGRPFFFLLLAQ